MPRHRSTRRSTEALEALDGIAAGDLASMRVLATLSKRELAQLERDRRAELELLWNLPGETPVVDDAVRARRGRLEAHAAAVERERLAIESDRRRARLCTMVNKPRRSARDMADLRAEILEAVALDAPTTCRSVFYRLVSRGVIPKSEQAYKGIVVRLLTLMRREGALDWAAITDGTRLRRKPRSYDNLLHALDDTRATYRRALWREQGVYVEVWTEKDAISGVLFDVTSEWDVPLVVCRGYPSQTFVHNAADELAEQAKPCFVYYFGDHDPSGVDIPRYVEARLREYAPRAEITFARLAVTREQIAQLALPTRPTKATDSRARGFAGESVEVDAIPPDTLRSICRAAIEQHVEQHALERTRRVEEAERETLAMLVHDAARMEAPP